MRQDQSTAQQLAEIEAYCLKYNLIHRHKFVDEARSGGSIAKRDDFNRMLDLYILPDQRPKGLLLWNYARFARDLDDAQLNKIRIRKWGIVIHSLNDAIPEGGHGRIIEYWIDIANEEKRKQTSADAKRGLKELVQKYGCVPGTPPLGFMRQKVTIGQRRDKTDHVAHRWVPDPAYKRRIQKAFKLKAAHATLRQIHAATQLYSSLNSYRTFFQNKLYIGILEFGDLTIADYCKPIVDRKTWDAVQKILTLHANLQAVSSPSSLHPRRRAETATYLLSGIVYCARCRSPLWGMSSKQRNGGYYLRYACTRAKRKRDCQLQPIPARSLETHVIAALQEFVSHPSNLRALLDLEQQENAELRLRSSDQIKELNLRLAQVRRAITNTTNHLAQRKHSPSLLTKLDQLEAQELQLQTELTELKLNNPQPPTPHTPQQILLLSKSLSLVLANKNPSEIRTGLLALTHSIYLDRQKDQVTGIINFKKRTRSPRNDEETSHAIITASLSLPPLGAHRHTRSIEIAFSIARVGRPNKNPG